MIDPVQPAKAEVKQAVSSSEASYDSLVCHFVALVLWLDSKLTLDIY